MPSLEASAVVINIIGVWLTARRSMMCWPIGMVGVLLYLRQFYIWHLYGDMILQGIYIIILAYGWYSWSISEKTHELPTYIQPALKKRLFGELGFCVCVAAPVGWGFAYFTNDPQPYIDSLLMCLSLLASVWTTRKYIENWVLWIIVDFIYALLFLYREDTLTACLYIMFGILAVYGAYKWKLPAT